MLFEITKQTTVIVLFLCLLGCSGGTTSPEQGGSISGTISGNVSGSIWVCAVSADSETPYIFIIVNGAGAYEIKNVSAGTYIVYAYIDENLNGMPDFGEPYGLHDSQVLVADSPVEEILIEMATGSGGIEGTITYEGQIQGDLVVEALGPSTAREVFPGSFPAEYEFTGLSVGDYMVLAFIDSNSDGFIQNNEPTGIWYAEITGDSTVTGVDFELNDAPAGTGVISGEVFYSGTFSGPVYIVAAGAWVKTAELEAPGPFELQDLPPGDYYLFSYMDVDGNLYPNIGDPGSLVEGPFEVSDTASVQDVELLLEDTQTDASISGTVTYFGLKSGKVTVIATGLTFTPFAMAEIGEPGGYTISDLAAGDYYVMAYMDADGNEYPSDGDPYGFIYGSASVESGEDITGEDIMMLFEW